MNTDESEIYDYKYVLVKSELPHWHVDLSGFVIYEINEWIEIRHKFYTEINRNGYLYHWIETAKHASAEYTITQEEFDDVFDVIGLTKVEYNFLKKSFGNGYGNTIIGAILDNIVDRMNEDDE
jgi:hypothetical protein